MGGLVLVFDDFSFSLQIDENVKREIMNHRSLKHPNIVRFKEVTMLNAPVARKS